MPRTPNAPLVAAAAILAAPLALAAAAPASAQTVPDETPAGITAPDEAGRSLPSPGLTEDRDVLPERDDLRGLDQQITVGPVGDESVLPGGDEDVLRGAGVGLRENETAIGEVEPRPGAGLGERDHTILNQDMGIEDDDGL
ncbi:hypothetical protein [Arenibaculum sp.]|jgi:hypothetical protein|uniref:hypothetical protein n=1 Tax=Arenibaculum sp. TaxID=2865862 RepID=UPI002E1315BA|nr:hypothetical protein [Arenibaculum sp.]